MTRFEKRMLGALALLVLGLALLEGLAPTPTDWSRSFSRNHVTPYGSKLMYQRLGDLFPEVREVRGLAHAVLQDRSIEEAWTAPVNHLYVNSQFGPDGYSVDLLLELVEAGDHVLIAAEHLHGLLADTLGVAMDWRGGPYSEDTTDARFMGERRIAEGTFRFARGNAGAWFETYDKGRCRVLAVDGNARPVLLDMAWGDGRIVLCSVPLAFTNYHLLKDRNAAFLAGALSLLPERPVWWDEHYKVGREEAPTPLRFILTQDPLKLALRMALVLLLLFIAVKARREQRAIPVVMPPANASRELMHTIGRLHWHRGDHATLARSMVAQFKEDVRRRTYLRTFAWDEATTDHLAAKTGLPKDELKRHLAFIQRHETSTHLTEDQILQLSSRLHDLREHL